MSFDPTALGISLSIVGCILFACLEFYKNKDLEIGNIALVFLAIFAISAGAELIYAALKGDPNNLPSSWREYLGVAGMVGIGLSLNFVISAVKKVLREPSEVQDSSPANE